MTRSPQISVVMSVYNNAGTLAAAMDSILAQEGVDFEFIVVNDGSSDRSASILDEMARRDTRIRAVHQENAGLTRALIRGCSLATAPWIARQDADDLSLPGRLKALHELALRHPDAGLVASSAHYIGPNDEALCTVTRTTDSELARRQLLDQRIGPPAHGCVMFSRDVYRQVGGYRACFYYGQDSDLWMRIAEVAGVVYTGEPLYCYRLSPSAISGGARGMQRRFGELGQLCRKARREGCDEGEYLARAERLASTLRSGRKSPSTRWGRARSYYFIGSLLASNRNNALACDYFMKAMREHPLYLRALIKWLCHRRDV